MSVFRTHPYLFRLVQRAARRGDTIQREESGQRRRISTIAAPRGRVASVAPEKNSSFPFRSESSPLGGFARFRAAPRGIRVLMDRRGSKPRRRMLPLARLIASVLNFPRFPWEINLTTRLPAETRDRGSLISCEEKMRSNAATLSSSFAATRGTEVLFPRVCGYTYICKLCVCECVWCLEWNGGNARVFWNFSARS